MRNIVLFSLALFAVSAYAAGEAVVTPPVPHKLAQAASAVKADAQSNAAKTQGAVLTACPDGCGLMNCPPPSGDIICCKKTTSGYVACPSN